MVLLVVYSSGVAYLFPLDFDHYTSIITVITEQSTIFLGCLSVYSGVLNTNFRYNNKGALIDNRQSRVL